MKQARRLPSAPNANSRTTGSCRLFDRSPTASSEPNAFYRTTTVVGKTASTLVSVSFFALLATRRDALVLTLWLGSILNAILGKVLKRLLDHERPAELRDSERVRIKPSDGGMPSSHAMSLGFIGVAICGGLVPPEHRAVAAAAAAAYAAVALRYRVRDRLHTTGQVAVGLALGAGNAGAWLALGVGDGGDAAGPVLSWVRDHWVSPETGMFPYSALAVPLAVGILVVGSFERRIKDKLRDK